VSIGFEQKSQKSHQRQFVDDSDPFYSKDSLPVLNPTNGSWWIVQILTEAGLEVSTNCRWWDYRSEQNGLW
jgi:hypothetical protein